MSDATCYTADRALPKLVAVDCEMCETKNGKELTRVSVTDVHHTLLLDMLVKPAEPIIDYLTQWSGITESMLQSVTSTLAECQVALLSLIDSDTILVGHGLENDLRALKIAHDRCIDTALCFPHPVLGRKHSLRYLAQQNLNLSIQTGDGIDGHDSTEDASTAMRLVLLRLRFGWDDVAIHNYKIAVQRASANVSLESRVDNSAPTCLSLKELIQGAGLTPNTVIVERGMTLECILSEIGIGNGTPPLAASDVAILNHEDFERAGIPAASRDALRAYAKSFLGS